MTKRFFPAIVAVYAVLAAVLIAAAAAPVIDLNVSNGLLNAFGSKFSYSLGNFFEIWAEPVTLIPGAFVMAMGTSMFLRKKSAKVTVFGIVAFAGGFACAYQTIYRTVKYYAKLENASEAWLVKNKPILTDHLSVKLVCIAAGVALTALFVLIANKIKFETLAKMEKVFIFVFCSYLCALITISVLKNIWGRMRFREFLNAFNTGTDPVFTAWFLPQGKPISDAYKSFPSGHTSNALQILPMTFIFDAAGKEKTGKILRICFAVWIVFIMFSRILAGAHYLSDVCGGAMISFTVMVVSGSIIFGKGEKKSKKD